jgi:hypothetical protein
MKYRIHQFVVAGEATAYVVLGACYLFAAPHPVFAVAYLAAGTFVVLHGTVTAKTHAEEQVVEGRRSA